RNVRGAQMTLEKMLTGLAQHDVRSVGSIGCDARDGERGAVAHERGGRVEGSLCRLASVIADENSPAPCGHVSHGGSAAPELRPRLARFELRTTTQVVPLRTKKEGRLGRPSCPLREVGAFRRSGASRLSLRISLRRELSWHSSSLWLPLACGR